MIIDCSKPRDRCGFNVEVSLRFNVLEVQVRWRKELTES